MLDLFIFMSKFIFLLCIFYFLYAGLRIHLSVVKQREDGMMFYIAQRVALLGFHLMGFAIIFVTHKEKLDIAILYLEQCLFFMVVWFVVGYFYSNTHLLLWNLALFFMSVGFVVLTRLDYAIGVRQFKMALLGMGIALVVPKLFQKMNFLTKLNWVYGVIAIGLLFVVNDTINGATNWLTIGNFTFQPSEFVKILYVLWIASFFRNGYNRVLLGLSAIYSGILILILVTQKDLGGALIFSILYISIVYIETNKPYLFIGGLAGGSIAAFVGYKFFYHVQERVSAWLNPWADINTRGYQIAQSLFAIGAGGWSGTGLTKGMPEKVPVYLTDFIFAAIGEEFGALFAIFIIGLFAIFFLGTLHVSRQTKEHYTLLMVSAFGILMAFQTFLIIGGVTKLVPSTGVTLPYISYGGTSLVTSCIVLGLIQGAYLKNTAKKEEKNEEEAETVRLNS